MRTGSGGHCGRGAPRPGSRRSPAAPWAVCWSPRLRGGLSPAGRDWGGSSGLTRGGARGFPERGHIARGADWGRIIGLTSGGDLGFPEEVSYGAAKAAQVNYTMSAAVELAPYGITANMAHPPVTNTGWVTGKVREAVGASPALIRV